jgi:mannosyltransferase PIG-V
MERTVTRIKPGIVTALVADTSLGRALRAVIWPVVTSRVGVLVAGLIAVVIIGYDPPPNESSLWRISTNPLANLLARWDTYWYLDIATHGYRWNGNPLDQQNVVFFPLLPAVMRVFGAALGGHPLIAGLVVSLSAFAAAMVYLWKWTADRLGTDVATTAVVLLCAFPFAVFFSAVYTESLFLLAVLGAWYHAERRQFGAATFFAFIAGLVRPNGCLLAIPLAWVGDKGSRRTVERIAVVAAPVVAVVLHSLYLASRVGDGGAWIAGQAAWPTISPFALHDVHVSVRLASWSVAIQAGNALALLLAIATIRPAARLLGTASVLFILVNLIPPALRHGLQSLGRFTSVLFPVFVVLAARLPRRRRWIVVACCAIGQIVAAMLFFTWRPLV